ncbi:P-loop containing nucleoside triphosphate hydrolase protein [Globomyces pollinis-pini]|nr:P-loop containing nucleoside triphosphate hydrolase protein [Globomyces pollinis-pini]
MGTLILRNKTVVLGNATVGKTSLIQAFYNNGQYSKNYNMTIHSELSIKVVNIPDTNVTVELFVHDLGGNDIFTEYCPKYCKGATSFMLVFDSTNLESFQALPKWISLLKHIKTLKKCKGILVATKLDQKHRRAVSQHDALEFAKSNNLMYFETSVVDELHVDAPFYYLAHSFNERFQDYLKETQKSVAELL